MVDKYMAWAKKIVAEHLGVKVKEIPEEPWLQLMVDYAQLAAEEDWSQEDLRDLILGHVALDHVNDQTDERGKQKEMLQRAHDHIVQLYLDGKITTVARREKYNEAMEWQKEGLVLPYMSALPPSGGTHD